jgi:hypothetical protein
MDANKLDLTGDQRGPLKLTAGIQSPACDDSVTIVVPTKNERENIGELLWRLASLAAAMDTRFHVIVIDDSDDDTAEEAVRLGAELSAPGRFSVAAIHRPAGERRDGLSGAAVCGLRAATSRWVVIMDGDLQHPPEVIGDLVATARTNHASMVVASRHVANERTGTRPAAEVEQRGLSAGRWVLSGVCAVSAHAVFPGRLARITDPMSGFFLVDREVIDLDRLRPEGFKIQLEILATHPEIEVREVPFTFAPRLGGKSKASGRHALAYWHQLAVLRVNGRRRAQGGRYHYDVHGVFRIDSAQPLPELSKLRVPAPAGPPDLVVDVGGLADMPAGESVDLTTAVPVTCYRERSGFGVDVAAHADRLAVRVSPFVAHSPHVLYTNVVEPILRWKLVERGYVLVHAACFARDGRAWLLTARTDTGKTMTMLKMLERAPVSFLSDDLTLLSPDGGVLTYPKPLTISAHTVHALRTTDLTRLERLGLKVQSRLHSREGRQLAFLLTKYHLPTASINAVIQRLVPPPKYHVERLVPGVQLGTTAKVEGLIIIQRGGTGEQSLGSGEALEILLENCDDAYGFPPYETLERMLFGLSSDDLRSRERELIEAALGSLPSCLMRSETLDWAERIPAILESWEATEEPAVVVPTAAS